MIDKVLVITAPFLNLAYIFSILRYFTVGWLDVYIAHTLIVLLYDVMIIFRRRVSTSWKIHFLAILFMLVAIPAIYSFGFTGGFYFGLISVAIIAILEGARSAAAYAGVYLLHFVVFGYAYIAGLLQPQVDLNALSADLAIWISLITGLMAMMAVLIWGFGLYYKEIRNLLKSHVEALSALESTRRKLEKSLQEKDVLFKELHHRIKNNLSTVSSLLFLKSKTSSNPVLDEFVKDTGQRINAISDIHNQLLKLEEHDQLYTKEYFASLISSMQMTYRRDPPIEWQVDIENHKLASDVMLNIGCILTEVLTNSLKYAYDEGVNGEVHVSFKREGNEFLLSIRDFGKGFDVSTSTDTVGLSLIQGLLQQCDGDMQLNTDAGTHYLMRIPMPAYHEQ